MRPISFPFLAFSWKVYFTRVFVIPFGSQRYKCLVVKGWNTSFAARGGNVLNSIDLHLGQGLVPLHVSGLHITKRT